jgi:hypothetical protein
MVAGPTHSEPRSPRFHARDPRAVASGRLGAGEELPAAERPDQAPVLVVCATCRQPIRYNEVLGISFCTVHGFSEPFAFIQLSQRRR